MKKPCVLFSPIGNSDPCRLQKDKTMRDGAMLHIIRYYHPEVVALFLTREMMKYHKKDDRYRQAIHAVCPDFKDENLLILDHSEIVEANQFELFDKHFRKELEKLHQKYPKHEILVNVTSGTPQMEASLYVLAVTLPFPIRLVQVNSPASKSNWEDHFGPVEDALAKLAESETSTPEMKRSVEVHPRNLTMSMQKENIKALLKNYDYQAVYSILNHSGGLFSGRACNLCQAAVRRLRLDTANAYEYARTGGWAQVFTLHDRKELEHIYEYILILDILLKRKAYADYARAVSPAITEIMKPVVSRCLGYSVYELCGENDRGVQILDPKRIKAKDMALWEHINHSYNDSFHSCPISADNMLKMLEYCTKTGTALDLEDYEDFEALRYFEENVRNLAAHTITSISQDNIRDSCGSLPEVYQEKLHRQFRKLYGQRLNWDDYDQMNDALIQVLDRK